MVPFFRRLSTLLYSMTAQSGITLLEVVREIMKCRKPDIMEYLLHLESLATE